MTTTLPSCRHGDVPGCADCLRDMADLVDPACHQCGRGTWIEPDGRPATVCDVCAAAEAATRPTGDREENG